MTRPDPKTRPRCPWCAKPLPLRTRFAYVARGTTPAEIEGRPVLHVTRRSDTIIGDTGAGTGPSDSISFWSGEFQTRYGPFDRLSCALRFAEAAYAAGYRRKATTKRRNP